MGTSTVKIFVGQLLLLAADLTLVRNQTFTYHEYGYGDEYSWTEAKELCECSGHLAVLDTKEKQMELRSQVNIPDGICAWIGASNRNDDRLFRWIELSPNYDRSEANDELLNSTYSNFLSDNPVVEDIRGVCVDANRTWHVADRSTQLGHISEWRECGPGRYKGKVNTTNRFCWTPAGQRDECVLCPGNKIKNVSGDDPVLCLDVCDEITSVANAERTDCVCTSGFYQDGSTCLSCLKLISGSGGENLTDGDTNTCSPVPFRSQTGILQYQLSVHDKCVQPDINVAVAIDNSTTCDDVGGAIFTEKPRSGCHDSRSIFGTCYFENEKQYDDDIRICQLKCKCAESTKQCMIHIFSGITPKDKSICEITAYGDFD